MLFPVLLLAGSVVCFPSHRLGSRDVGLWPDEFLDTVATEALAFSNDASPDDTDDPDATGTIGGLANTPLYSPSGLSTPLTMSGVNSPVTDTFTNGAYASGSFSSSGWAWQSTGLLQYGGCDVSVQPSLIESCFNMQLSADPTQDLELGQARQRIEIYSYGANAATTWRYSWKTASPPDVGSNGHFFHSWQILSRGGPADVPTGPVVYLDYVDGAAAIGDTVRCHGICAQNGQGVNLAQWLGRVVAHSMTVTFGPNGSVSYTATDAASNAQLLTYSATGEMGGTNLTSLKFGLYRAAVAGMSPARAFVGDFSAIQLTSGGLTVGSFAPVGLPTVAGGTTDTGAPMTVTFLDVSTTSTATITLGAPSTTTVAAGAAATPTTSSTTLTSSSSSSTTSTTSSSSSATSTTSLATTIASASIPTAMLPFPNVETVTTTIGGTDTLPPDTLTTAPTAGTVTVPTLVTASAPAATTGVSPSGDVHHGPATWYEVGVNTGACGWNNNDQDMVVAVNTADYANGAHCGQTVNVAGGAGSFTATVVDLCPTCDPGGLDLSPRAFQILGSLDTGVIAITWSFG